VPHSTQLHKERIATRMPGYQAGVRVVRRHHLLVRYSHWLNLPVLLGLILSGVSIYWASPVYKHKPDPVTGNFDPLADVGRWICVHVPTHLNGKPLTVEHGAPLRLLVPVKLGLKNIKAITRITYTGDEPADYWAKRGYSRYD
jgi:hypothetical protein